MILKIITSNPGKVKEFQKAFLSMGIDVKHEHIEYDEIQTSELEEVVRHGMNELRSRGMKNFIIDDSGLFIDSLNGFPGVYSAYAQKTVGNKGILDLMQKVRKNDRGAEFRCCIGCDIEGKTIIVEGISRGVILEKESGKDGFGFDPIFSHDGRHSFAEISIDEKNTVSHRGLAINMLADELRNNNLLR